MKTKFLAASALALLALGAATAYANTIVNNLSQPTENSAGPIGNDWNSNDFYVGQQFTIPSGPNPYQLTSVTLLLNPTGGGANITAGIWNVDPNNNPSNQIAVVSSQFVVNAGNVEFLPSTNITLAPGIYYLVVTPTTPSDSGYVSWAFATSTNWTGEGTLDAIADTLTGGWENYSITNLPQQMDVEATPVTPTLALNRQAGNTTLSWSSVLNGYVVDAATNLAPTAWQAITNTPTTVSGTNSVTTTSSARAQFFRLRQSFAVNNLDQPPVGWDGPIGNDNNANDFLIGEEFTLPPGNYTLNKVTLPLTPVGGAANITVSIWNVDSFGNPGIKIANVSSQYISSTGNVDFVPTAPIILTSSNYYVEAAPTTPGDSAKIGWYWTISPAWTGFGTLDGFAGTYYGNWQNQPLGDGPYQMSVEVTPAN